MKLSKEQIMQEMILMIKNQNVDGGIIERMEFTIDVLFDGTFDEIYYELISH